MKKVEEAKRNYIARLSLLISSDYRSGVGHIRYVKDLEDEYAEITFEGGHMLAVNITGRSLGGIYKDVGRAVYGY